LFLLARHPTGWWGHLSFLERPAGLLAFVPFSSMTM
jgi:hypothetical protein